jgi:hypothetical protein
MDDTTLISALRSLGACDHALEWAESLPPEDQTTTRAWALCERPDWLLWLAGQLASEETLAQIVSLASGFAADAAGAASQAATEVEACRGAVAGGAGEWRAEKASNAAVSAAFAGYLATATAAHYSWLAASAASTADAATYARAATGTAAHYATGASGAAADAAGEAAATGAAAAGTDCRRAHADEHAAECARQCDRIRAAIPRPTLPSGGAQGCLTVRAAIPLHTLTARS